MSELWENREERDAAVAKRRRVDRNRQTYWTALAAVTVAWIVTSFGAAATVEADRRADVFASMRSLGLWFGIGTIAVVVSVAAARALNERLAEFFEKHLVDRRSMAAHRVLVGAELILLGGSSGHLVVQFWQIPGASALETGVIVGLIVLVLSSTLYFAAGPAEHRLEITAALTAETVELRRRAQLTPGETQLIDRLSDIEARLQVALEASLFREPAVGAGASATIAPPWRDWWTQRPFLRRRTPKAHGSATPIELDDTLLRQ